MPDLEDYISGHIDPEPDYLHEIERHSNIHLLNGRMCSGHSQGRLLKMIVEMIAPERVLELGTFSGYSALCIAGGLPKDAILYTVEVDDELEEVILGNFSKSPDKDKIRLLIGDARKIAMDFPENYFDLIFIDADKQSYPDYYSIAKGRVRPGGYIIADNILWDGHVLDSDNSRDRQTTGIKRFNELVAADPDLEKAIIPIRDGLTLIRRIR